MKDRDHLVAWLRAEAEEGDDDAEPVAILKSDLSLLQCSDIPMGLSLQVLEKPDDGTRRYPALDGTITRLRGSRLVADIGQYAWRKSWPVSLGIEQYHDLVRAAVELRSRRQGDVKVVERVDDNVYGFYFRIDLPWGNLHRAFAHAVTVHSELLETAEAIRVGIDDLIATAFKRLEGWGAEPLDALVERMRMGNAQDKGRTLEELASRLFNTVPGFQATGHVYTETEEIDIRIQNTSDDPFWRRESYLLVSECKNWSGKCGKDELVLFKSKLHNRIGRVSCGFLISWNGFAETVTKEMLRGSEGTLLVVPVEGADLRAAVRDGDFPSRLKGLYENAVFL